MNTVHEPGPPVTLKYHRSKNQFKKPSQMHKHPASPAGTPRSALARPGARMAAVSWPCPQPCRGKGPAVSQQQCRSSRASARAPAPSAPAPAPARSAYRACCRAPARSSAPRACARAAQRPSAPPASRHACRAPLPSAPRTPAQRPCACLRAQHARLRAQRLAQRPAPAQLHNLLQYDFQPTAPKIFFFFFHDK